jgi:hypothetical protein
VYHLRDYRALLPGHKTSQKKTPQAFLKNSIFRVLEQGLSNKAVPFCLMQIQFELVSDVFKIPAYRWGSVTNYYEKDDKNNLFSKIPVIEFGLM